MMRLVFDKGCIGQSESGQEKDVRLHGVLKMDVERSSAQDFSKCERFVDLLAACLLRFGRRIC